MTHRNEDKRHVQVDRKLHENGGLKKGEKEILNTQQRWFCLISTMPNTPQRGVFKDLKDSFNYLSNTKTTQTIKLLTILINPYNSSHIPTMSFGCGRRLEY